MKKTFVILLISFVSTWLVSVNVWAIECSEVVWEDFVLSKHPNINEFCQGVVEVDGQQLVQFDAKFLESHAGKAMIKFIHPDGTLGDTFKTEKLGSEFRVMLDGRPTKIRDIPRNSELTVYMPPDRFQLIGDINNMSAENSVVTLMAYEEMLPSTGSALPFYFLIGGAFSFMGLLLTFRRKMR